MQHQLNYQGFQLQVVSENNGGREDFFLFAPAQPDPRNPKVTLPAAKLPLTEKPVYLKTLAVLKVVGGQDELVSTLRKWGGKQLSQQQPATEVKLKAVPNVLLAATDSDAIAAE